MSIFESLEILEILKLLLTPILKCFVYDMSCVIYDISSICHMTYDILDICQIGCLKKPQDLSNQASNCKSIYNLIEYSILNSK
jgi:hypothetical protein